MTAESELEERLRAALSARGSRVTLAHPNWPAPQPPVSRTHRRRASVAAGLAGAAAVAAVVMLSGSPEGRTTVRMLHPPSTTWSPAVPPTTPPTVRPCRQIGLSAAAIAVAGLTAGCGTTHHASVPTVPTSASPTTLLAPTTGGSTTTILRPAAPPPTNPQAGACQPAMLSVTFADWNGAGGTGFYGFDAANRSTTSCQIGGYFGAAIYTPDGQQLTADTYREPTTTGGQGPRPINLTPGATATFTITMSENPQGNATTCPSVGSFHLTPPNAYQSIQVSVRPSPGNAYWYCGGALGVQPTQPGTS